MSDYRVVIPTYVSPLKVGVMQVDGELVATSGCCTARIYWRGSGPPCSYCSKCKEPIHGVPEINTVVASLSELSVGDIRWWVSQMTGIPERELEVTINQD